MIEVMKRCRTFAQFIFEKLVTLLAQLHNLLSVHEPFGHVLEDFVTDGRRDFVPGPPVSND